LTCKMRLGWDEAAYEGGCAAELACRLVRVGVAAITVHGRTTEMRFKGQCRHDGIRRVVEAVAALTGAYGNGGVPVIGNGDVRTPEDCVRMLRETGCAGVMIGRGSLGAPWIFRDCWALQTTGVVPPPPSEGEKIAIIRRWFDRMVGFRSERHALAQIRSRISWLGKEINGSHCRWLKDAIRAAQTPGDVHAALDGWL
ncbi:MAG: tRNA-dihydrouridine synthase, partial [Phycisphaerales bacterium]|nr:tRNA-dihydrouridine synthase [Phycisphaerales bacterium]